MRFELTTNVIRFGSQPKRLAATVTHCGESYNATERRKLFRYVGINRCNPNRQFSHQSSMTKHAARGSHNLFDEVVITTQDTPMSSHLKPRISEWCLQSFVLVCKSSGTKGEREPPFGIRASDFEQHCCSTVDRHVYLRKDSHAIH